MRKVWSSLQMPDIGGLYVRPTSAGGLLIGANDSDAVIETEHVAEVLTDLPQSMLGRIARYLPSLSTSGLLDKLILRIGVRPMPDDEVPIVGPLGSIERLYVAVTHSGVTLGPLIAHLLAREITTGASSPWLDPYRPSRFGF
jgi:glycine/D-amino acid oxidase-like deaminating enzyme